MNLANRNRWLDRCALRIRAYVKRKTPQRGKRSNVVEIKKGAA